MDIIVGQVVRAILMQRKILQNTDLLVRYHWFQV